MKKEIIDGFCVFIDASENYYHFISESIRSLLIAKEKNFIIEKILVREGLPKSFYVLLKKIAFDAELIILRKGSRVTVENLLYSLIGDDFVSNNENFSVLDYGIKFKKSDDYRSWISLQKNLKVQKEGNGKRIIYLSRPYFESRGIIYNSRITELVSLYGGTTIDHEYMKNNDYYEEISEARIMLCSDGAGISNAFLMKKESTVIELGARFPSWKNIIDALELKYVFIPTTKKIPMKLQDIFDIRLYSKRKIKKALKDI